MGGCRARRAAPPPDDRRAAAAPGTFHEVSFAVLDVRAAVEFYERLGFTQATTTDTLSHPYGVLSDGRLSVGLHQRRGRSPVLTFVRPGIAGWVPQLTDAGIRSEERRVGKEWTSARPAH